MYGATPFSGITSLLPKMHAIASSSQPIAFPDVGNPACEDLMRRSLERDPQRRITMADLLSHPFIRPPCVAPSPSLGRQQLAAALLGAAVLGRARLRPQLADALADAFLERAQQGGAALDVAAWVEAQEAAAASAGGLAAINEAEEGARSEEAKSDSATS